MTTTIELPTASSFADSLIAFQRGEIDENQFKKIRVELGVYSQRQESLFMIRTKIPAGSIDGAALRSFANVAEKYGDKTVHLTSRQDAQIHFVPLENISSTLLSLDEAGITTVGAGGNTLRNINVCEHGHSVISLTKAVSDRLSETRFASGLPRKVKISFCGQPGGCGAVLTEDIGVFRSFTDGTSGEPLFDIYIGGGQGAQPKLGRKLVSSLIANDIIKSITSILDVFIDEGAGVSRNRSRMKFLIDRMGIDKFQELYKEKFEASGVDYDFTAPSLDPTPVGESLNIRAINADYNSQQLNDIAGSLPNRSGVSTQVTKDGAIAVFGLSSDEAGVLSKAAKIAGLVVNYHNSLPVITACNGAATCREAFTNSKGLGARLEEVAMSLFEAERIKIRVSGCPNACSNSHTGDIGLIGTYRRAGSTYVPSYQIYLGGSEEKEKIGTPIARVPARRAVDAVTKIASVFSSSQKEDESFYDLVERLGIDPFREVLASLTSLEGVEENSDLFHDLDSNEGLDLKQVGPGECGGAAREIISGFFDSARQSLRLALREDNDALKERRLLVASQEAARGALSSVGVAVENDDQLPGEFSSHAPLSETEIVKFSPLLTEAADEVSVKEFIDAAELAASGEDHGANRESLDSDDADTPLLDLSGVTCPFNYVKAKVALEPLDAGSLLALLLDDGAPMENVPQSLKNDGHEIVETEKIGEQYRLVVKKAA